MNIRKLLPLLGLLLALAGSAIFAAGADGYVYWSNLTTIGRAANDGTGADPDFIPYDGSGAPICGVAVDDEHIYWSTLEGDVGRADIDGSNVDWTWIDRSSQNTCGIAVDGSGVYVTDGYMTSSGAVSASNLAGSGFSPLLPATGPCGVAVSGGTVLWQQGGSPGTLLKSSIAAPGVEPVATGGDGGYCSLAAAGGYAYYNPYYAAAGEDTPINRIALSGSAAPQLIATGTDVNDACGLAHSGGFVYWKDTGPTRAIGRVRDDGSAPATPGLVTGAAVGEGCGIAADELPSQPPPPPPPAKPAVISLGKPKLDKKKGTATVPVTTNQAGPVALSGKLVKPSQATAVAATTVKLKITARRKAKKELKKKGKAGVSFTVTFSPAKVASASKQGSVKLKRKRPKKGKRTRSTD